MRALTGTCVILGVLHSAGAKPADPKPPAAKQVFVGFMQAFYLEGGALYAWAKDGTLWAWGHNDDGQLGDGTTSDQPAPVQIGNTNKWVAVAAGGNTGLGVKSDGTLWSWGRAQVLGNANPGSGAARKPTQIGN